MEQVIASFDPRTNTYEAWTAFYDSGAPVVGDVVYQGSKFYTSAYGRTYKEAEKNALDSLLRYFAERSMFHADKGTRFADYCNFICDVQRKKGIA